MHNEILFPSLLFIPFENSMEKYRQKGLLAQGNKKQEEEAKSDHDVCFQWWWGRGSWCGRGELSLYSRHLPTIIASVLAAFVSIRNFLTWTFTPLDVRLPTFLCELFGEFSFWEFLVLESLKRLWHSVELLCLSAMGSFEHDDDIMEAWLEDVVDIVGLVMCSVDGYDIEIVTLSLCFELRRFLRSNEGIDVTLAWFVLKPSKFVVEFDKGKSDRWFLLPRWIRNVTFSSSKWLFFPPLPFLFCFVCVWFGFRRDSVVLAGGVDDEWQKIWKLQISF